MQNVPIKVIFQNSVTILKCTSWPGVKVEGFADGLLLVAASGWCTLLVECRHQWWRG